MFNTSRHF